MDANNQDAVVLGELRARLQEKVKQLKIELDEAERKLSSVSVTMDLLGYKNGGSLSDSGARIEPASLKGLTQEQALVRIAKANDGAFHVKTARRLLLAAGLISNPKNASNIIYNVIARSGKFIRKTAGEYELRPSADKRFLESVRSSA